MTIMDKLKCKACGSYSIIPVQVALEDEEDAVIGPEQESQFYTCQVCGDNWLSVQENDARGGCQLTFVHQMGMQPVLKRTTHVDRQVVFAGASIDHWDYFVDGEAVAEDEWRLKLTNRRAILRSICSN